MTFIRYTEGYEGDHPMFTENPFTMAQLYEYESRRGEDLNFTYAEDWGGFNLTGRTIKDVIARGLIDINKWDEKFLTIWARCVAEYPDLDFSLLGVSRFGRDNSVITHETAHAFYAQDPVYKKKMDNLVNKIPLYKLDKIFQILAADGYTNMVWVDEVQAYFATGINGWVEWDILDQEIDLKSIIKPFQEVFKEQTKTKFKTRVLIPHIK